MMGSDQLGYTGFLADLKEPYRYVIRLSDWKLDDVKWIDLGGELVVIEAGCDSAGWPLRDAPEGTV